MTYRIYFNSVADWPLIWSVDGGDVSTECHVVGLRTKGHVTVSSGCVNPSSVDREREPVGWMNITAARMHIEHSVATFYGE